MTTPGHVVFVFASRGIGGAERSMLRLMAEAHPARLLCRVIVPAAENVVDLHRLIPSSILMTAWKAMPSRVFGAMPW